MTSCFFCLTNGIVHQQSAYPPSPVLLINDDILYQCPGSGFMRKIGYSEEHQRANNLTLVFSYQKLMTGGGADLGEDPLVIVWSGVLALLGLRGSDCQLTVKVKDTRDIALCS